MSHRRRVAFEERTIPHEPEQEQAREPRDPAIVIQMLTRQIETLKQEQEAAAEAIARLARGEKLDEIPEARPLRFQLWTCYACGARLGMYDKDQDVLQGRYKEWLWWVHTGEGGWFKTVCRSCCAENRLDYSE